MLQIRNSKAIAAVLAAHPDPHPAPFGDLQSGSLQSGPRPGVGRGAACGPRLPPRRCGGGAHGPGAGGIPAACRRPCTTGRAVIAGLRAEHGAVMAAYRACFFLPVQRGIDYLCAPLRPRCAIGPWRLPRPSAGPASGLCHCPGEGWFSSGAGPRPRRWVALQVSSPARSWRSSCNHCAGRWGTCCGVVAFRPKPSGSRRRTRAGLAPACTACHVAAQCCGQRVDGAITHVLFEATDPGQPGSRRNENCRTPGLGCGQTANRAQSPRARRGGRRSTHPSANCHDALHPSNVAAAPAATRFAMGVPQWRTW